MTFLKCRILFFASVVASCASSPLFGATLSAVPMQGGMVMPMISYRTDGRLHVMVDATVPQLTPLLVSNPADDFDPADPWFAHLSPTREGYSFSRRYGFVMDTITEPLPAGTQMWIRKISSSEGLSAFRYSNGEPRRFEPIFGTAGSSNAMHWNGMMFHPTFTARPGTNELTAVFEAYLVEASSGAEVPNTSTGPFTLRWTNLPDGRPNLRIEPGGYVSWPLNNTNYVLESTTLLSSSQWTAVTGEPVSQDDRLRVPIQLSSGNSFFRMRRVP